jgi:hypothetical protein
MILSSQTEEAMFPHAMVRLECLKIASDRAPKEATTSEIFALASQLEAYVNFGEINFKPSLPKGDFLFDPNHYI